MPNQNGTRTMFKPTVGMKPCMLTDLRSGNFVGSTHSQNGLRLDQPMIQAELNVAVWVRIADALSRR